MLATNESFPGMGFELDFTRLVAHDNASNRPRPLTGHELFSMFPAPPPKHLADPTSLYFGKEEREFFARLHHPKFDAASDPKQEYDRHAQRSLPPLVSPRHRRPDANPDDFPPSPWTSFTPIETFSGGPNGLSAVDSDQGLWRQRSRAPDMRSLEKQRTTKKPTFFCKYEGCHSRVTGFTTQRMLQRTCA
ncbi:hypothetical protein CYLTODRAFT_425983 [Cylindrobasidium torrendii FP15055 ss-10]|uniref:Uncharacterized protein n=1 Tax=Cylindrobasidium torrendii FP15055 ss-10 TaxID=1314674 RepID=A0A0D7B0B5_9AGAR|nr:hypothetical protein CYLTODRAFT_425983 [Cylindrobasidium torrendii FP15055 ss-10]